MGVEEGGFLVGEGGGVEVWDGCWVGDGVFGALVILGLLGLGGGGSRWGDQEEIVHAVFGEFGEALAEEGADEVLGAGEVRLEDGEFEVEGWVVGVCC